MADEPESNAPLFEDVVFTIIPSDELSPRKKDDIINIVCEDAGQYKPLYTIDQQIENLSELTHIISTHVDFPQYTAALEHGIHVVMPSWVVRSAAKRRQAPLRQHSPDPSQYFREVIVSCADLPEGDKDAIIAGVIALGGQYSSVLSKLVTHIVTTSLEDDKCELAKQKNLGCKIVLPHWFDDCFRLGRMIKEEPYKFPDPELLRVDATTRVRDYPSKHLEGAIVASPIGMPQSTPPPSPTDVRRNLNAFMSRKIFLAEDLQLGKHLFETLRGLINHGGGTLADDIESCHIYIGQFRDGKDYVTASRAGKTVANLSWLYHVINRNKYTDPLNKLLHYPVPREGVKGFENMRISISNYTGDARIYLENLIRYCGAQFTKTMKQDNTHLITAHTQSEKCEAAREWNINIVNHIWLEESYAKSAVQTLTNPRYTYFPARTNLGEVTGQTRFDVKSLELVYFPKSTAPLQKFVATPTSISRTKTLPKGTLSKLTLMDDNDLNQDSSNYLDHLSDDEQPQTTTKRPRGRPPKSATTPRIQNEEKENESPLTLSSGRAAKQKAADRLHDQMDDIALFQKEMKRKGGVTHGGRRSSLANVEDMSSPAEPIQRKKRKSDECTYDVTAEGSDLSDGETQDTPVQRGKRAKNTPTPVALPPVRFRMLVSGDDRWLSNTQKETRDRLKLRQLGILLTAEPHDVDILVAPRLLRTRKFVCALASAPKVVGIEFLDNLLKKGEIDEDPPLLVDRETEKRRGLNLARGLERAKINNHQLFRGWSIFVTNDVNGGFDTFKDIISVNGGACLLYAGRTGLTLPRRRIRPGTDDEQMEEDAEDSTNVEEADDVYLVAGDSKQDVKLRGIFRRLAEKQGLKARVVTTDWLLHAAMAQEIVWKDEWEWSEEADG